MFPSSFFTLEPLKESDVSLMLLFILLQSIHPKQLGPYGGGSYTVKNETVKLEPVVLKTLGLGINIEKVVFGKVVCSVHNDDAVPL
jgi:hypothetical protein